MAAVIVHEAFLIIILVPSILMLLKECVINISGCLITNGLLCARKYVMWAKYMAHGIRFAKIVVSMLADSAEVFHRL